MAKSTPLSELRGYEKFLGELKQRIQGAQLRAGLAVNRELVLLYWSIGKDILRRQNREGWGARVIDRLGRDLTREFPEMTGFSARNLKYMRKFAETWRNESIVQATLAQLPWYHHIALLEKVKNQAERIWYAQCAVENGWSRNVLVHQIEAGLHKRQGRALNNFSRTLPAPQSELARQVLKDPYNFDFLSLGSEMLERDLERGLIAHLRDLIIELGKGFAFVGSQYRIEVADQDYYLDLLFYHLRLRCYIVFELKTDDFKPEFAGKMNFYLSAVDDLLRHSDDATSIGIILCRGRNRVIVEYALRDTTKPMSVAQYRLTQALPNRLKKELPTTEELAKEFPLFSLVRLRIKMEQDLAELVHKQGVSATGYQKKAQGVESLASILLDRKVISTNLFSKIREISKLLNRIVHGGQLDADAVAKALAAGQEILAELNTA